METNISFDQFKKMLVDSASRPKMAVESLKFSMSKEQIASMSRPDICVGLEYLGRAVTRPGVLILSKNLLSYAKDISYLIPFDLKKSRNIFTITIE